MTTQLTTQPTAVDEVVARFYATSTGHSNGGNWIIGPCVVEVVVTTYSDRYAPTYSVRIDGQHGFGGFARHMTDPTQLASWLIGCTPIVDTPAPTPGAVCQWCQEPVVWSRTPADATFAAFVHTPEMTVFCGAPIGGAK